MCKSNNVQKAHCVEKDTIKKTTKYAENNTVQKQHCTENKHYVEEKHCNKNKQNKSLSKLPASDTPTENQLPHQE